MNLCDDGHTEICFEGRHCPWCEEKQANQTEIDTLNDEINELKETIKEMEAEK